MSRALPLIAALFLALTAIAEPPKKAFDPTQFDIPHETFTLDNGLRVVVHEDHAVPLVSVNLWYHVGSRNEKRGKTGFAHLFEHFFFNGSENYPHGFREAMDDVGATNRNGATSFDQTIFLEDVPVSALERTLYLEADRMGFLAGNITREMLERERGVVKNEKRQGEDQPYGKVDSRIVETIFPSSHPYSWAPIGSMEDLDAATLDDVKEWYRTYYGPNNCVLVLAGDITVARAKELAAKYFGGIPAGPPLTRAEEWIPKFERNVRDTMQDRVPQTRIYRVWFAPAWRDPRSQHMGLLAELLGGSKSARLERRLVYDKELATGTDIYLWEAELASMLVVEVSLKPGVDAGKAEKELDAAIAELIEKGPTTDELQRAQSRSLARFVRGAENVGGFTGRSAILAESATFGGDPGTYLKRLEWMATATSADVQKAARTWLDTHHYTMTVTPFPQLAPGKTEVDRKVLPTLGDAPEVTFPRVQRATLSNGLQVMLMERHSTPLVELSLAVDAGHSSDAAAKAGLAGLALAVLDEGTATRDAFRIADDLDAQGAQLTTVTGLDLSYVELTALPMNLRPSLEIFADVVTRPAFPEDKVALNKTQRGARIRQEQAQPNAAALRVLPRLLYPEGHPYAKPFTGSGYLRTLEPLTREDLVQWHRTWFVPNNATLIVAGDVTLEKLVPELERTFGSWKRGEAPKKDLANVPRTAGKRVYLIDKPDAAQSVIVAGHVSERGGLPEDLAVETVLRNFGGMSTSRLNRNLRLDKHWSYGSFGTVQDARGPRMFFVVAPVQADKTKEAIVEVQKEIRGVAGDRPIAGEEFASIMRNQTLRLPGTFEGLDALTLAGSRMVIFGRSEDYYANYARNVRALSERDLNAAAAKVVRPDEVVWVIVGDLKKIEAGVRELNLGEVVRYSGEL